MATGGWRPSEADEWGVRVPGGGGGRRRGPRGLRPGRGPPHRASGVREAPSGGQGCPRRHRRPEGPDRGRRTHQLIGSGRRPDFGGAGPRLRSGDGFPAHQLASSLRLHDHRHAQDRGATGRRGRHRPGVRQPRPAVA